MKRGETWTAAAGRHYVGKPRPVVIVQDDRFATEMSITVCTLTSDTTEASLFRLPIEPTLQNGLSKTSVLMVDKISTIPRHKLGQRIGQLADGDVLRLNRAIMTFLGLAAEPATSSQSLTTRER